MTGHLWWLVVAGSGAGLVGSMAGLASMISYPALLAFGLPPFTANVTNTVGLFGSTIGSVGGSLKELRGNGRRLIALVGQAVLGGLIGAGLLLSTPPETFEAVVPWLVASGALLLLCRDRLRTWAACRHARLGERTRQRSWAWPALAVSAGIYAGYFGAGAGVIMLAVLSVRYADPFAVTNAAKNVGIGAGNAVAAVAYAFLAPVNWPATFAIGAGAVLGSWVGPQIVRVIPERPLRYAIAAAGFGLAVYLVFA